MQKITTFLTFKDQAEEAMDLYISVFPDSKILSTTRYGEDGPGPRGALVTASFQLSGRISWRSTVAQASPSPMAYRYS
jgi:predicted 3-demethylubiquinone-9 3-methyltransferase (glyoxalase superfamily)